jgi:hypothetical protein
MATSNINPSPPGMIPIGTKISGYGVVCAVGWIGERYYWMGDDNGISMIPAATLEPFYRKIAYIPLT